MENIFNCECDDGYNLLLAISDYATPSLVIDQLCVLRNSENNFPNVVFDPQKLSCLLNVAQLNGQLSHRILLDPKAKLQIELKKHDRSTLYISGCRSQINLFKKNEVLTIANIHKDMLNSFANALVRGYHCNMIDSVDHRTSDFSQCFRKEYHNFIHNSISLSDSIPRGLDLSPCKFRIILYECDYGIHLLSFILFIVPTSKLNSNRNNQILSIHPPVIINPSRDHSTVSYDEESIHLSPSYLQKKDFILHKEFPSSPHMTSTGILFASYHP